MDLFFAVVIVAVAAFIFLQSGGSMTGGQPNSTNPFINAFANAIAVAENANSTTNNPGNLTAGDVAAEDITGVFNNVGVVIIDTVENGWNALTSKLENILAGNSSVYSPNMTIQQFADTYTGGDNSTGWAQSVADSLGVTTDTTISDAASQSTGSN